MIGKRNKFVKRAASFILAGCLFFQGFGESVAEAVSPEEIAAEVFSLQESATEEVLCEEGFESGTIGKWLAKDGTRLSVDSDNPRSGNYCMKISGRTMTSSGAKLEIGDKLKNGHYLAVSAYAKYTDGPQNKKIQVTMSCDGRYYGLGGGELTRSEWGEITGSLAVPSGVNLSDAVLFFETPWKAEPSAEEDLMDIYVDDVKASLIPFCDTGDYPSLKELYKDQFRIGLAVPDAVLNTPEYSQLFSRQCNSMTMENEMKPAYIMDEATSKSNLSEYKEHVALNFNAYKNGLEYAKQHGIAVRGHVLVWHSQTPDWFFYENYDTGGKRADRDLMLKRMENYIKEVIAWTQTNYPGVIYAWDVVNEAVADYFGAGPAPMRQEDSLWYQTIGEDFVQKAFAYARKYTRQYHGEDVQLFYNDYNEYFPAKREGIISLLKPIKEAGNIDGVGMQSHIDTARPLEGDSGYMTTVRKFRDELGLQIHVTELDIGMAAGDTEESQGDYYQKFMEALLKEKRDGANITSLTFWGLTDGLSWRPGEQCLLFRDDLSRKPAFEGVIKAIGYTGEGNDKEDNENPPPAEKTVIKDAYISSIPSQVYTGRALKPAFTVTCNGKKLVKDRDYTVAYKNNINIGKALAVVCGKGDYEGTAQKEFTITVKKNKVYTVGDYKYKITDAKTNGKGCVALAGIKSNAVKKRLKKINVAATVKIGGKSFKVTSIGRAACQGCPKAAAVTIGSNVTGIGEKAFYNCKKIKKITIKSTKLKSVGKNALKNIHAKAVVKTPKRKLKAYRKLLKSKGLKRGTKISF